MKKNKSNVKLTPPDITRCQAEILQPTSFMTLGPRGWQRCTNRPTYIATEVYPSAADGLRGKMSVCDTCAQILQKDEPGRATLERIPR